MSVHVESTTTLTSVIMAKWPQPGKVKTRLIGPLTAYQAAAVHAAMLQCVLDRLNQHLPGSIVLAVDPPHDTLALGDDPELSIELPIENTLIDQDTGDLGNRIMRAWEDVGSGPTVFFGVDSPDIPVDALKAIPNALTRSEAACGPVDDGGYWCLAARQLARQLLIDIDWGTSKVYHQTQNAAARARLSLAELPAWHDVDTPDDLDALRQRIRLQKEPALTRLAKRLDRVLQDHPI